MSLSATALVTLTQAKSHLRTNAAASLYVAAEYVGVGDGADQTFSLDNIPVGGSLRLYVNNVLQVETTDFSISGADITFVTAPTGTYPITASYDTVASDNTFDSYDDDELETLVEAATLEAERHTGRAFVIRTVTEEHFGDATTILRLFQRPVESVTSVVRRVSDILGLGDGSTVDFSLAEVPTAASLVLYVDTVVKVLTTDYTISGKVITFVSAPSDGAWILAKYTHTILPIKEFEERLHQARLYAPGSWTANQIYVVVYQAGYGETRAATQALLPDVVAAVLMILAYLWENRTDMLHGETVSGVGAVTYELPLYVDKSGAKILLAPYKVNLL